MKLQHLQVIHKLTGNAAYLSLDPLYCTQFEHFWEKITCTYGIHQHHSHKSLLSYNWLYLLDTADVATKGLALRPHE